MSAVRASQPPVIRCCKLFASIFPEFAMPLRYTLSAFADEAADDMDGQIKALLESKIGHVDLRNVDGHNIGALPLDHARKVKQKLDAAGLKVGMYGTPIGKIDLADDFDIDVKKLQHMGELKNIFGARNVRIFSYWNKKAGASEADFRKESVRRLTELAKLAQKLDLVLYHENEVAVFGDTLEHVKVLRDELHAKFPQNFKLIFDSDNFNQCNQDVWTCWTTLRDAIEAVHFKDSNKVDGSFQHCPVGQGNGRYPDIVRDLASRNWSGPMTLEPHLARSAAVLATGPHGQANQSLADLTPYECFQLAAKQLHKLLGSV
jgi:sugar phosphate isomerase/epimerase